MLTDKIRLIMEATIMILEKINAQHIQVSLAKFAKKKSYVYRRQKKVRLEKKLINNRKTS